MRSKILYFCESLDAGGAERVLRDVLAHLSYDRYDVVVCVLGPSPHAEQTAQARPYSVISLGLDERVGPLRFLYTGLWRAVRLLRSWQPSIVHSQGQRPDLIAQYASMLVRVPVLITTCHSRDVLRDMPSAASLQYRVKMFLEDRAVGRCDAAIAVSPGIAVYLAEQRHIKQSKIHVIPNPIAARVRAQSTAQAKRALLGENDGYVVGFVGRLAAEKNVGTLIDAFLHVCERLPAAQLVIAGDGPLRASLERMAAGVAAPHRVRFLGAVTDVGSVMEAFDVLVMPSFHEGFGLVMAEAMSLGVPVIVPALTGIEKVVRSGSSGIIVRTADMRLLVDFLVGRSQAVPIDAAQSAEIAGWVERLWKDGSLRMALGDAARERARTFPDMQLTVRMLESLYDHELSRAS